MGSWFSTTSAVMFIGSSGSSIGGSNDAESHSHSPPPEAQDFEIIPGPRAARMDMSMIGAQRAKLKPCSTAACMKQRDFRAMSSDPCETLLYNRDLREKLAQRRLHVQEHEHEHEREHAPLSQQQTLLDDDDDW